MSAAPPRGHDERRPSPTTSSSTAGGHVLVVDDNEVNRDLLTMRLEARGYQVTEAIGGAEALEMLEGSGRQETPGAYAEDSSGAGTLAFDAVLLDIMMPEISGLDVLRRVRRQRSVAELPIIMQTALDESAQVVEALSLGANDYITKPIDFPVLYARLETHLRLKRLSQQKDEFLAIASHDLKNPLAVVRGFARIIPSLVPEGQPMSAEALELLQRIVRQTEVMQRIVTDFLDFQALEDGKITFHRARADMVALARESLAQMGEYASSKDVRLQVDAEPASLPGMIDVERARQVLDNFISNAIKFAPREAEATVIIRPTLISANGDQPEWPGALVEVRDSGPGIAAHEMPRLFQKYARLSNRPTGGEKSSGVGLSICKQLIELQGGEVGVRNNVGQAGATFWFTLPL